ncbi:ATPase-like, ParA/MinD [Caldithrix abyssi DSM 13497]|uniref:Iron-sulfur cluster carrier protein n=1 Tax=Caldithrix abyssi DSM 13497 TaxID=880073 RepID=H1XXZ5_CALAY|nr:P-loop NTPase [Caldithrix abyssi]APF20629.1 ATP-binding protein involved in chromosome partitioning [Caldithrix abyssi DSM 13497]EHO40870.1 ATPase-like, ParA/MinD [Caldithrix abyssi DSM 13497]
MPLTKEQVIETLRQVNYPGYSRDIVSFGLIQKLDVSDEMIRVHLVVRSTDNNVAQTIKRDVEAKLKEAYPAAKHEVVSEIQEPPQFKTTASETAGKEKFLAGIKHKVAVASGKGGVGKSTVAVNLAVALVKLGKKVGLLDADIYGPSIPLMLGVDEKPLYDGKKIQTIEKYGVHLMSLGFLIDNSEAVIWRGALVHRALQQLMSDVAWPELDIILFDMPPGTGDAQLTLSQSVSLDGAVIVSTPQDVALIDAIKGVQMFRKVNVPIMGIIENMSYFVCPHCGERTDIFDHGGVAKVCAQLETELLGEVPIDARIREGGDGGKPIVAMDPESPQSKVFLEIAQKMYDKIENQ